MDEKLTVELDDETMTAVRRQAEAHGRDVAEEVQAIVRRNVVGGHAAPDRSALGAKLRSTLPPQSSDSLTLLREDRQR